MNERPDPIAAVAAKYKSSGYDVIISPRDKITDLIAKKDRELFFVQVVTPENADNPRFQGIPRGDFIQNAFSNGATPTHAKVVTTTTRDGKFNIKITFEDINAGARRIVTNRGNQKDESQPSKPQPPKPQPPKPQPPKPQSRTQSTPELRPKPEPKTSPEQSKSQPQKPQQPPKPKIVPKRDDSAQTTESTSKVQTEPKPKAPRQPRQTAESNTQPTTHSNPQSTTQSTTQSNPQTKRIKGGSGTGQK